MFVYSTYDKDPENPVYTTQALISARSLRRHTTNDISLLTNNDGLAKTIASLEHNPFTEIKVMTDSGHPKLQKILAIEQFSSGDKVFLDADTIILDSINQVFDFCDFDICGVISPGRYFINSMERAVRWEARRKFFLNSGVLFIREAFVSQLVPKWAECYRGELEEKGQDALDQPALKMALSHLNPNVFPIPHNYNFRIGFGGTISGKCFVVHGRFHNTATAVAKSGWDKGLIDEFIDSVAVINDTLVISNFPSAGPLDKISCVRVRATESK